MEDAVVHTLLNLSRQQQAWSPCLGGSGKGRGLLELPVGAHWCLANAKPDSQACTGFAFLAMDL
eukprot:11223311-Lingulodinium_polyedra.AAC.1